MEGLLTGGNVHDVVVGESLFEDVVGCYAVLDAGYDSDNFRRNLESNNNIPVIPGRSNRKVPIIYDKKIYKLRRFVEIMFGKIKENKRLVARFDKLDETFLAFISLAILKNFIVSIIS